MEMRFILTQEQMKEAARGLTLQQILDIAIQKSILDGYHEMGIQLSEMINKLESE